MLTNKYKLFFSNKKKKRGRRKKRKKEGKENRIINASQKSSLLTCSRIRFVFYIHKRKVIHTRTRTDICRKENNKRNNTQQYDDYLILSRLRVRTSSRSWDDSGMIFFAICCIICNWWTCRWERWGDNFSRTKFSIEHYRCHIGLLLLILNNSRLLRSKSMMLFKCCSIRMMSMMTKMRMWMLTI